MAWLVSKELLRLLEEAARASEAASVTPSICVIGQERLALALERAQDSKPNEQRLQICTEVPEREGVLVVSASGTDRPDLQRWHDALVPGGALVIASTKNQEELSRAILCAGFNDIGQRRIRRKTICTARKPW